MTIVSKRKFGFTSTSIQRRREPHAFTYLSERATFWIAVLSVFAFVTGNMVGQHGWSVFWKSVMGEGSDSTIAFTGMVPPIAQVPDYQRWALFGGDIRANTFRQVPLDLLIPLPAYIHHGNDTSSDQTLRRIYFVEYLGTYVNGRGLGSHVGTDISVPVGTPVLSVANGIVVRVGYDAGGFGNFVVVKHPNVPNVERVGEKSTLYSVFAHLSSVLTQEGTVVQKGDQIALSGQSGNASAPHLHFQMDRDTAPFHPYWPFNAYDEQQAHMNFTQAIDQGLNRANGVLYTLDPMLTVQTYATFVGPVVAQAQSSSSRPKPLTMDDRRKLRLAKLAAAPPTLLAYTENAPVVPIPVSSSQSSSAASGGIGPIASVRITHDGSFTKERSWEKVLLQLLDKDGRTITAPASTENIYLRTAFGRADFTPSVISVADFKNGIAQVQMFPLGETTVVVEADPMRSLSQPMRYIR